MKKTFCALFLSAVLMVATSTVALAGDQDFLIHNNTGFDIHELHVSPTSEESWGEDVLDEDILADGESATVHFDDGEEAVNWDIMITDEEGNSHYWRNIDLIETAEITIETEGEYNIDATDEE